MTLFASAKGNTLLSAEEAADLIPSLSTREELNQWERQNIIEAGTWALDVKHLHRRDCLTDAYVRELHRRMFDQTWKWAGRYRTTEKNIGIPHHQIRDALAVLLADVRFWLEHQTYSPEECAIRFHHRLVAIHCFPNGNGRHARLIADVLMQKLGLPVFTWGGAEGTKAAEKDIAHRGDIRLHYLQALRAADAHDIHPLLLFARS
jgi:Fic-DOC domain mobile mystery protein B